MKRCDVEFTHGNDILKVQPCTLQGYAFCKSNVGDCPAETMELARDVITRAFEAGLSFAVYQL